MSDVPAYLVADLDRLADRPRSILNREVWFPLAVFGVLALVSAAVFDRWDPETTSSWLFWVLAGPVGALVTMAWFRQRSISLGIWNANPTLYTALSVLCYVGCGTAATLADPPWTYPAVFAVVGVFNVVVGVIDRSGVTALVGAAILATGVASGVGGLSAAAFCAILGCLLIASAAIARATE